MTARVMTCVDPSATDSSISRPNKPLILRVGPGESASTSDMAASADVNHPVSSFPPPTGAVSGIDAPISTADPDTLPRVGLAPATSMPGSTDVQAYPSHTIYDKMGERLGVTAQSHGMPQVDYNLDGSEALAGAENVASESETEVDASTAAGKDFQHTAYDPTLVKHRRRTTVAQLEILDAHFAESPKPDMDTRRFLSKQLGMTVREVQVWFQNRRAKQKKIDSRAQKAAERTTSPPSPLVGGPVLLNAPQQLSASSFASSTGFSECSVPSVPSYGPPSGYSIAYTPSSISSRYSDIHEVHQLSQQDHYEGQPFGSTIPYYPTAVSSTLQESYPPYVQCSYFPDVSSDYSQTPFAYQPVEEKAFLPSFSGNVMNSGLVGQDSSSDAWASRQSRPLAVALDGLNTPVSVSPASSKSSSLDENLPAPRVRNGMPHVLSNLGGLSIVPYPDNVASQEPIYAPGAMPVISSTLPPAYGTAMVPPSWQSMPNGMPSVPPHSLNDNFGATSYSSPVVAGPSMISPTSTTFPAPPMGPSAAPPSAIPHYGGGAAGYPYSHSVSTDSKVVQPMSSQTVQPSEQGLQSAIPLAVPLDMSHVSATLAARRQSLQAYPGDKALPRVSTLQQQSRQGMLPSIPKGFSMMDDSSLPLRRASMSAMNSNTPIPRHQSSSYAAGPLDPERQAVLDSAAQAVLPLLASPPLMLETGVHQSPKSPAHLKSERGASATTASSLAHPAFEDTPILGGLRRGSIPKKVKSPTSTYSPYPQIHMRRASEQVNSRLT